jgi:hypothetical protein
MAALLTLMICVVLFPATVLHVCVCVRVCVHVCLADTGTIQSCVDGFGGAMMPWSSVRQASLAEICTNGAHILPYQVAV